jgi:hypothetical protein
MSVTTENTVSTVSTASSIADNGFNPSLAAWHRRVGLMGSVRGPSRSLVKAAQGQEQSG